MSETTLFTKIINGEIPCQKLYEDERTFVFLDLYPRMPGHTLVIPKNPVQFVWDLPDDDYQAVMTTAKRTALQLRRVMDTAYVAEHIYGLDVPHAHVQLIPFNTAADLARQADKERPADEKELARLAQTLAF